MGERMRQETNQEGERTRERGRGKGLPAKLISISRREKIRSLAGGERRAAERALRPKLLCLPATRLPPSAPRIPSSNYPALHPLSRHSPRTRKKLRSIFCYLLLAKLFLNGNEAAPKPLSLPPSLRGLLLLK